jgi:uncharacterized membrane protein
MPLRAPLIWSAVVIGAMLALSAWAWMVLPADAALAVHWGMSGSPDRFGGKAEALLLTPVIAIALAGLLAILPALEPRREHLLASAGPYNTIWISLMVFMGAVHTAIVLAALGVPVGVGTVVPAGVGFLFIVVGLQFRRLRSTFFVGIRTPWTLSSERSWEVTHRLGAWLFVGLGLLVVLAALLGPPEALVWSILGGVIAVVIVLAVVSYVAWRDDPNKA